MQCKRFTCALCRYFVAIFLAVTMTQLASSDVPGETVPVESVSRLLSLDDCVRQSASTIECVRSVKDIKQIVSGKIVEVS